MNQQPPPQSQVPNPKKSSFQITSVTIDSSVSNDGGDESGDELDSHTEDSSDFGTDSSRHPSESRGAGTDDNFSRNDVFFNSAPLSSMGSAPVIPTSSQFGLAIVSSAGTGEVVTSGSTLPVVSSTISPPTSEVATTETQAISSSVPSVPSTMDKHETERDHVHNRFKVVKIVSTEPLKKGRWTCMDYCSDLKDDGVQNDRQKYQTTTTSTTTATNAPSKDPSSQLHSHQIPHQLPIPHGSPPHQPHATIQSQGDILHQQGLSSQGPMTSSPPQPHLPVLTGPNSHLNDPQQANILQAHNMQQQNVQVMPPTELPQHPVDSTANMNGLNNGNSYLHMNHNIGVNNHSHNSEMHHVQNASSMNINHSMVSSTNIPNVAVYQTAPHQQQQQYYTGAAVVQGNMGPKQGYSTQPQVITGQGGQQQQAFPHQQLPNHDAVQHSSNNPPLGQGVQPQVHQQLPGQSLPHGSVIQMTSNVMGNNGGSQQQQPHSVQSLGHTNLMQQAKVQTFLPPAGQQGQVQQSSTQFTQQPAQQIMSQVNIPPQSSQAQCSNQPQQQAPPQQLMPQQQQINMQQQQQSQSQQQAYQQSQQPPQTNMMMTGIPNIHQQHHIQMSSSQVPIQMQVAQGQPGGQSQAIYNQQPQMHQVQMSGQQMGMSNQQQILSQQPQQMMQTQTQYSNQPTMVNQQAPQQQSQLMMMNAQQIQGQPQQQNIMPSQQMVSSQVMQNSQMNTLVQQPQMVNQSTLQGQVQHLSMHDQPYDMQSIQGQNAYQNQQSQPQTTMGNIQNQGVIHQQQFQQSQPAVVQQTMMTPQMNQMSSGQHVQSQMQQSQPVSQHSQVPIPQPQQQPMSLNQEQQTMQMYQNQQPIQTPSSMNNANTVQGVQQNLITAPPSNNQMGGQFVGGANLPQISSGAEITTQPVGSSTDHQQHMQVSQPQVMSGDGHSNSQSVMQTQSQPVLPLQPQLSINTNSQPSLPSTHSSGTPVGDGSTTHSIHTSTTKSDDTKSEANDDGDSASGTNTVAIDNKIEQAMDLVKSHLMFAVREEVEVLKEKISELMERITQLEHENTILRAGASQETLAILAASKPPANSNCANANS